MSLEVLHSLGLLLPTVITADEGLDPLVDDEAVEKKEEAPADEEGTVGKRGPAKEDKVEKKKEEKIAEKEEETISFEDKFLQSQRMEFGLQISPVNRAFSTNSASQISRTMKAHLNSEPLLKLNARFFNDERIDILPELKLGYDIAAQLYKSPSIKDGNYGFGADAEVVFSEPFEFSALDKWYFEATQKVMFSFLARAEEEVSAAVLEGLDAIAGVHLELGATNNEYLSAQLYLNGDLFDGGIYGAEGLGLGWSTRYYSEEGNRFVLGGRVDLFAQTNVSKFLPIVHLDLAGVLGGREELPVSEETSFSNGGGWRLEAGVVWSVLGPLPEVALSYVHEEKKADSFPTLISNSANLSVGSQYDWGVASAELLFEKGTYFLYPIDRNYDIGVRYDLPFIFMDDEQEKLLGLYAGFNVAEFTDRRLRTAGDNDARYMRLELTAGAKAEF